MRENRRRFGVWRRAEDGRSLRKRVKKSLASGTGRSMGRQIPLWECFPVFEGSLVPLLRGSLPFAGKSAPLLGNRRRFGEWGKGRWKDGFAPPKGGGVGFWGARPCGFGGFYAENPILTVIFSF